jgi:hypothetical protein
MGTAVGRSICYNCGNVAKVESDYCNCVRNRTAYGEINIDLSPIELSLVVTGADPRAKLRNVIASLNKYSEEKEERINELKKAGCVTPDELDRLDKEIVELKATVKFLLKSTAADESKLRQLSDALDSAPSEVREKIQSEMENVLPTRATGTESEAPTYQIPEGSNSRFESDRTQLQITAINDKLDAMVIALRDLSASVQIDKLNMEDSEMSDNLKERAAARRAQIKSAYLQGGGGVNDPQTYPVDPMNDSLRTKGDKQMEGENMATGSTGMYPGDEQLKKMLSRAELEERKLRRHANGAVKTTADGKQIFINEKGEGSELHAEDERKEKGKKDLDLEAMIDAYLMKSAYMQGGGGVNDPQTYPVDPMNNNLRTKGDKQMEGQNMETGSIGMYPGDEQAKKLLLRADQKLRAKFVMAYKNDEKTVVDKANSRWEIYAGADKVLEARGSEIYEDQLNQNWDFLASKRYGREVLRAVRNDGLDKVAAMLKGAEPVDALAPVPPVPGVPGAPVEPEVAEKKDDAGEIVVQIEDQLKEVENKLVDLKDVMGDAEATELPSAVEAANDSDDQEVDDEAKADDANCLAVMDQSADELAMLAESLESRIKVGKNSSDVVTAELIGLSKDAIAESKEICKAASVIIAAKKGKNPFLFQKGKKCKECGKDKCVCKKGKKEKECKECGEVKCVCKKEKKSKAEAMLDSLLKARAARRREMVRNAEDEGMVDEFDEKFRAAFEKFLGISVDEAKEIFAAEGKEPEHTEDLFTVDEKDCSDMSLADDLAVAVQDARDEKKEEKEDCTASRRAWRQKVAAEASAYQQKLDAAVTVDTDMPVNKSFGLGQLDTKTPESTVEGIVEMHDEIMKQVNSLPNVREAVKKISDLVKSGKLSIADLKDQNKLNAFAIDPDAAKYFSGYFGEGDADCKGFAQELVKDYDQKKAAASLDESRAKMRRAYDLALEAQDKGLIPSDPIALHAQVDEMMKFDDRAFESYKKAIARMSKPIKTASSAPAIQMGVSEDSAGMTEPDTFVSQLGKIW